MRNIISFMHISLDGFVAGTGGELSWVKINPEIFAFVGERVRGTNAAIYGRKTFDMMEAYWPTAGQKEGATAHDIEHSRWYNDIHKWVLSTTMADQTSESVSIVRGALAEAAATIKSIPGDEILVFGSPTATHSLLRENLVDGFWLFLNPVILGGGIPLFTDREQSTQLKLRSSHAFSNGVIALDYNVVR